MGLLSWLTGGMRRSRDGEVDIASPAHKADPYPFYARLRAESPVHRVTLRGGQAAWLVTRYDDVAAVLKDDRFAKDRLNALTREQAARQPWVLAMFKPLTRNMLDLDPPDHTRLRGLVQKAFIPRLVEQLRPRVETLAGGLLDRLRGRPRFDLIRDFALPIPTTVIAEMLGVPAGDRDNSTGGPGPWSRPTRSGGGGCSSSPPSGRSCGTSAGSSVQSDPPPPTTC